jgi:hypothetical protein
MWLVKACVSLREILGPKPGSYAAILDGRRGRPDGWDKWLPFRGQIAADVVGTDLVDGRQQPAWGRPLSGC